MTNTEYKVAFFLVLQTLQNLQNVQPATVKSIVRVVAKSLDSHSTLYPPVLLYSGISISARISTITVTSLVWPEASNTGLHSNVPSNKKPWRGTRANYFGLSDCETSFYSR